MDTIDRSTARKTISFVAGLVLMLGLSGGAALAGAGSAGASEPATQSRMRDWSPGRVLTTSTTWGRARDRIGFEWTTSAPYRVRPVVQVQIDWPTNCTASATIGAAPSVTVQGCTANLITKPGHGLAFHSITMPLRWSGPGVNDRTSCRFDDALTRAGATTDTWTCKGGWMDEQDQVSYTATALPPQLDVADDGEGLKPLEVLTDTIDFQP